MELQSEEARMRVATVLLVLVVEEFQRLLEQLRLQSGEAAAAAAGATAPATAPAAEGEERLSSFYVQWSWEFLLRTWREVLGLEDLPVFALKQMLHLHFSALPPGGASPTPPPAEDVHVFSSAEEVLALYVGLATCPPPGQLLSARTLRLLRRLPVLSPGPGSGPQAFRIRDVETEFAKRMHAHAHAHACETGTETGALADTGSGTGRSSRGWRKWKIGLATLGGGAALALTGGLAAPFVAAGLASVGSGMAALGPVGAVVGGALTTTGAALGAGGTVALFGAGGAGLTSWKVTKRWGDLEQFEFGTIGEALGPGQLETTVGVSGWLSDDQDDFEKHWRDAVHSLTGGEAGGEAGSEAGGMVYLKWESGNLRKLGGVLYGMIRDEIARGLTSFYLTAAFGTTLSPLLWPVWVLNSLSDMDNAWLVCKDKAVIAGEHLAETLLSRSRTHTAAAGPTGAAERPVTLVGFSMGTVVIFEALQYLYKKGEFNRVSHVVLLGAPISSTFALFDTKTRWLRARQVVAGRFVNVHSSRDWLLALLARYLDWGLHVAGLSALQLPQSACVEDVDVSDLVAVHTEYAAKLGTILQRVAL